MPGDITKIDIHAPGSENLNPYTGRSAPPQGQPTVQVSDRAYEVYDKNVDPGAMFLNDLTRECFAAQLVYTGQIDKSSPLPGYSLVRLEIDGVRIPPNMNGIAYLTFAGMWILSTSRAISTTNWHDDHSVEQFALDETMGIIDDITANADYYELANDELIYNLALSTWKNLTAVGRRGNKGGFLDILRAAMQPMQQPVTPQQGWKIPWIK